MSNVTNAMVVVDTPLEDEEFPSELFNNLGYYIPQQFKEISLENAGGYKGMEVTVFACAFNNTLESNIIDWFHKISWRKGDKAVLILSPQGGGFLIEHSK